MCAIGLGGLWLFAVVGAAGHVIIVGAVISLALVLLFAALGLNTLGARLVLFEDTIEYRGPFWSRRLRRDQIAGRRRIAQQYGQYVTVLVPAIRTLRSIRISSGFTEDETLRQWIAALPDLNRAVAAAVAADETLGSTPEERYKRLRTARHIASALDAFYVLVVGWTIYPHPYRAAIATLALLPAVPLALVAFRPNLFRLTTVRGDVRPSLAFLFVGPGLLLLVHALLDVQLLGWQRAAAIAVAVSLGLAGAGAIAERRRIRHAGAFALLWLLALPYGYGVVVEADVLLDRSPPEVFRAEIQGKHVDGGKIRIYDITLSAWGPHDGPSDAQVSRSDYAALGTRLFVCPHVFAGRLAIPWFIVSGCKDYLPLTAQMPGPVQPSAVSLGEDQYLRDDYAQARRTLSAPAARGNAEAALLIGLMYRYALGVPKNDETALALFRRAAAAGSTRAMNAIGYAYDHGLGVVPDTAKALAWYSKAADAGEARALNNLAILYYDGKEVPQDAAKARRLWLKAVEQGHSPAMGNLGNQYAAGIGVARDMTKAVLWWRRAARLGLADSQMRLADLLLSGDPAFHDPKQGLAWLASAARQGRADAAVRLGMALLDGTVVPRDAHKAAEWFRRGAEHGSAAAAFDLGRLYEGDALGPPDYAEAQKWLRQAADADNAEAENSLGVLYQNGTGVPRDVAQALAWYNKAAAQDDVYGELNLAETYWFGRGVAPDEAAAIKWYRRAASHDNPRAEEVLGESYRLGKGVTADPAASFAWHLKAAKHGIALSLNDVGYSLLIGYGVEPDPEAAYKWLLLAVKRSEPGDLHDRASVNLTNARARLNADQIRTAQREAQPYLDRWAAEKR